MNRYMDKISSHDYMFEMKTMNYCSRFLTVQSPHWQENMLREHQTLKPWKCEFCKMLNKHSLKSSRKNYIEYNSQINSNIFTIRSCCYSQGSFGVIDVGVFTCPHMYNFGIVVLLMFWHSFLRCVHSTDPVNHLLLSPPANQGARPPIQ